MSVKDVLFPQIPSPTKGFRWALLNLLGKFNFFFPVVLENRKDWKSSWSILWGHCNLHSKTKWRHFPGVQQIRAHLQRRGHSFGSWLGAIPHATEQLSLCALEPVLRKRSHWDKKPNRKRSSPRNKGRSPGAKTPATREGPLTEQRPLRHGVPQEQSSPCNHNNKQTKNQMNDKRKKL